jgi:plasmid stabilization system protein ParE
MNRFVLTPAAEGDLLKIIEYLEGDNPHAVLRVVDALDEAMQRLAENPGIGHVRPDLTDEDVRFWPVFKYLVIYRPKRSRSKSSESYTAGAMSNASSATDWPQVSRIISARISHSPRSPRRTQQRSDRSKP